MSLRKSFLSLGILAGATACNPLVYGELIDQAPVRNFSLNALTSGNPYGHETLRVPGLGQDGRILMLGDGIPIASDIKLSPGYEVLSSHPNGMQLNDLFRPLMYLDTSTFGGIDVIPNQSATTELHALIGITSSFDATSARVMIANIDGWSRVTEPEADIIAPRINDNAIVGFGQDVQAINLNGPQSDAAYEVAVGSAQGPVIFDALGTNTETYLQNRADILAGNGAAFDGDNLAQGFHFTLCDTLSDYNRIGRGQVGPAGIPAFIVSAPNGISIVTDQDTTNQVGAPIYDCDADFLPNPGGATDRFGEELFVTDLNGDGRDDLFVGDPGINTVYLYLGGADGLPTDPSQTFETPVSVNGILDFGASIDRAELGGGFGSAIVITAPESSVGGTSASGVVFVYRINDSGVIEENAEPIELADLEPERNTRYGFWAGGIYNDELGRDELMVLGQSGGRIHTAIAGTDPG
jgi:hypothetical protein